MQPSPMSSRQKLYPFYGQNSVQNFSDPILAIYFRRTDAVQKRICAGEINDSGAEV